MSAGRSTACLTAFSEPTRRRPLRLLPINSPTSLFSFAHPDKIYPDKEVKYGAAAESFRKTVGITAQSCKTELQNRKKVVYYRYGQTTEPVVYT